MLDSLSVFWVAVFATAVIVLALIEFKIPLKIPPSLKRMMAFDIPVPKGVQRIAMWLLALAILAWLIRDLDDTLRQHYFCERHPDATTCPQAGDTPPSPYP